MRRRRRLPRSCGRTPADDLAAAGHVTALIGERANAEPAALPVLPA
ncbi:hypothetical protein ACHGLA_00195 [Streptomyces sp. YH02]